MSYTYEDLKKKTLAELRQIADGIENEAVKGHSQMHKNQLLPALCQVLKIEMHEHHNVTGIDKTAIKAQIKDYKKKRDEALNAHDHKELKRVRREMHHLKRLIQRATT
ncbi:MAG: hypothetical protein U0V70_06610 [Terriglobia bacterium]